MSLLKMFLMRITGNSFAQRLLEKNVGVAQSLMGIGSGGEVESSGEKAVLDVLVRKYKPPYYVFDVGSSKGQYLNLLLKLLPLNHLYVHCFEPGTIAFGLLVESSRRNDRIKLNNIGLGKEAGEVTLYFDKPGSELASLTKRKLDHFNIDFSRSEIITMRTLDDYCLENGIVRIHLLKLDIEGHELDVLAGSFNMLHKNAIDMVVFEFGGCNIDSRSYFQDFYYFFEKIKMQLFRITPSGYLYPITSYREIFEQFRTTNFIAMSHG